MILVADNLHALNPIVSGSLDTRDPKPLQQAAKQLAQAGADALDLNPGYLPRKLQDHMAFMVTAVRETTSLSLMLDHPNARVLEAGIRVCRSKPILNGVTLEPDKLESILPLAVGNRTELVGLLLDERGMPAATVEEKAALAVALRRHALAAGMPPEDLIFDPILPNLSWPDAFAQIAAVREVVRLLSSGDLFGQPARTMVGLSNLRGGMRRQYGSEYDSACLGMLAGAGLQIVLADVTQPDLVKTRQAILHMNGPVA